MQKKSIALIFGGISSERDVSLNSGKQVFDALDKNKYDIATYDPKTDIPRLVNDADGIDCALIILHGPYGEDGTVQGLLDLLDIPYQGAGVLGSAVAMNKLLSKGLYEQAGLTVPPYAVVRRGEPVDVDTIVTRLGLPLVVKPVETGSSVGMSIVRTDASLEAAVGKAFGFGATVMIEAHISGTEITCGVLGNDDLEALPLIEIIPGDNHEFFDYDAKYQPGATREVCPAPLSAELTRKAQACAIAAHRALYCQGYSRTDMILKDNEFFILETNTIPGMTATSLYPQSAEAAGFSFGGLLDRLIELGMDARRRQTTRG
ncbi:D-alanine--D-alanine ligase [Desulfosarcina alkanivorans]|uniref:D-alanine--D-alanine ligase n=1 Tax=Desulfosarcina alkanivorans TaxID=571177 RepID=A0A5K7YVX3_9BACT|nr:D-alanine--D-alanine ligase [Desulfosarcina alkanivorans]BBO72153.1 D-alanine--D-alanine ligase [Desulfosarcina alkanivorans]